VSVLDEVRAAVPNVCSLCRALGALTDRGLADEFAAALALPPAEVGHRALSRVLARHGVNVSPDTVQRHRFGSHGR
jgi:hypothetical protein